MSHEIYIALGTNLGKRESNLRAAIEALPPKVRVVALSPIYETAPWRVADQPDFLNQVIRAETELSPQDLLDYLKQIEMDMGRKPTYRYGPRLIDLDILFYDDCVMETPGLSIPHPRLHKRAFVLVPLMDLNPQLQHPITGQSVKELLEDVDRSGVKKHA